MPEKLGPNGGDLDEHGEETKASRARRMLRQVQEWESTFRDRFTDDLRFRHGDSENGWQWPGSIMQSRMQRDKPCLTMNIVQQHNLQVSNASKIDKTSMTVKAAGNGATKEAADMLDQLIRRIERQSGAQEVYSTAQEFQVDGGVGYWRITTEYLPGDTFDQEIFLRKIPDPLCVYMDPDAKMKHGGDANFCFVVDRVPPKLFGLKYPEYKGFQGVASLGNLDSSWANEDFIQVTEMFERVPSKHELLSFIVPGTDERKTARADMLPDEVRKAVKADKSTRSREIIDYTVEWTKFVGDEEVDSTEWPDRFLPVVRVPGQMVVIDGQLDIKSHTRGMKDAQRMYNYNASAQVEHVALQSKVPYLAPAKAIDNFTSEWSTANTEDHAVLPWNHIDDDGQPIPPPVRQQPPTGSPAFESGMETAFNQMMMVSGQWQNQMGMMGNERTGEAISQRQEQGDVATYHFKDAVEGAKVWTCERLIEIIRRVYDTKRILLVEADDGTEQEMEINPAAAQAYQAQRNRNGQIARHILNPTVGRYEVVAASGAAYATRREQTVKSLTLLLTQAPALTGLIGDLLLKAMDFKEAEEGAQRMRRMVPPQALGEGPTQEEQRLQQQVQHLTGLNAKLLQEHGKAQVKLVGKAQMRDVDVYKAETDRVKALADVMAQIDPLAAKQIIDRLMGDIDSTGPISAVTEANADDLDVGGDGGAGGGNAGGMGSSEAAPPHPHAQQAPDGEWYLTDPTRMGRYLKLAPLANVRPDVVK